MVTGIQPHGETIIYLSYHGSRSGAEIDLEVNNDQEE